MWSRLTVICLALVSLVQAQTPPSNLPDEPPGVFAAHGTALINRDIEDVWQILLDFPKYPEWNPFVRSQVVANELLIPTKDQIPHENSRLFIQVQIPPLPQPVNASTPANPLNAQTSIENITTLDNSIHRAAWTSILFTDEELDATRWNVLSVYEGLTYYETREIYRGALASSVQALYGKGLQEGFQAQADALKERAEST